MNDEKTVRVYYEQPYLTELGCKVTRIEQKGSQHLVELDRTIFYPEGGGQPSDQGELAGKTGKLKVEQVRTLPDGRIVHQGSLAGLLAPGDEVHAVLKWPMRLKNMRVHTAGHLVHDVLMSMAEGLTPVKGSHSQKAFLEYAGHLDPTIAPQLQTKVNDVLGRDLPVVTRESNYEELSVRCRFVPPTLPRNKPLRIIQIGEYDPMPDGGVHVKTTREIEEIVIHAITSENNVVNIRYGVKHGSEQN